LNLNRRADRLSNLNKLLNGTWLGQQACRVPAVDAHKFGSTLDPSLVHEDIWSNVHQLHDKSVDEQGSGKHSFSYKDDVQTPGSIALRMGHALMWEHFLQHHTPFAIFMEDDVNWLHPKFNEAVCNIAKGQEPIKSWEWIQLQSSEGIDTFSTAQPKVVEGTQFCLGMYVMKRDAANKSLSKMFPIDDHSLRLDSPKGILRGSLEAYRMSPSVANAPSSKYDSDVQTAALIQSENPIPDCQILNAAAMFYPQLLARNF